ncbi:MAG: hypothetical protein F7B17_08660 [Desulfurococcales archaeon]|nr:hypothetical protein [Desulfurococcales archaeon]
MAWYRRGQASPITVAILVGVTILLGLGVYAFFQGQAATLLQRLAVENVLLDYARGLDVMLVGVESDTSTAPSVYCFTVSISNKSASPLTIYLTVLPVTITATTAFTDDLASIYPYPASTDPLAPESFLNLRLYLLTDLDGDGLIDLVGSGGTAGTLTSLTELMPSCREVYSTSIWDSYIRPDANAGLSRIVLFEGFSVEDLYRGFGVSYYPEAPLWLYTLQPGDNMTFYIALALEDPNDPGSLLKLTNGSLLVIAQVGGDYYVAESLDLARSVK